jgi:hypothetical protein
VAFLNWRFGLTQMTAWRIEVAPFPDLSNVPPPTKPIVTIPITLYGYGKGNDAEEGAPERRRNGLEHGEQKRVKARRYSRPTRPLGDRRRDMLPLHPAAAFLSPRAPGPRPACPGRSPRAGALAVNAAPGSLLRQPFYTTLVKKSQQANGASELRRTPFHALG